MSRPQKNKGQGGNGGNSDRAIHDSGLTMPRSLFARLDRVAKHAGLRGRGELLLLGVTTVLDMCQDHKNRYLPEVCVRYDSNRPNNEEPRITNPSQAQRAGTHFARATEDRIKAVIKPIGWSRNQFITESTRLIVDWCEDPATRTVPLVAVLNEAACSYVPLKLKCRT